MVVFITQIVAQIAHMATSALPGAGMDAAVQRIRMYFERHALEHKIHHALRQALEAFKQHYRHHPLLAELEQHGAFHERSPLVPLLALMVNDPAHHDIYLAQLGATFTQLAPHSAPQICVEAAAVLQQAVRRELDAIPEMGEAQRLLRDRLRDRSIEDIYTALMTAPLLPNLRAELDGYANSVAARCQNSHYSTAHLLYALACRHQTSAQMALARARLDPRRIYGGIAAILKVAATYTGHASPNYDQVILAAQRLAGQRGAPFTRDDHILEALLDNVDHDSMGHGSLGPVLNYLGVTTSEIRRELHHIEHDQVSLTDTTPRDITELPTFDESRLPQLPQDDQPPTQRPPQP